MVPTAKRDVTSHSNFTLETIGFLYIYQNEIFSTSRSILGYLMLMFKFCVEAVALTVWGENHEESTESHRCWRRSVADATASSSLSVTQSLIATHQTEE